MRASVGEWAAVLGIATATALLIGHAWGKGTQASTIAVCVARSQQTALATLGYVQDYDQTLPDTSNSSRFRSLISPYLSVRTQHPPQCPATGEFFVPNAALSFEFLGNIADYEHTELLRDPVPHAEDGLASITYFDGHVERGGIEQFDPDSECADRARQVAVGLVSYLQDYDERFPPRMEDSGHMQQVLAPYVRSPRKFVCPATQQLFAFNPALSRVPYYTLNDQDWYNLELLRDAAPHPSGALTVAYLDLHVEQDGIAFDDPGVRCEKQLRTLMMVLLGYAQSHNNHLPPSLEPAALVESIGPMVGQDVARLLRCPETGNFYYFDPSLAGRSLASLPNISTTEVGRDAHRHRNGRVWRGYGDGHVSQEYVTNWFPASLLAGGGTGSQASTLLLWAQRNQEFSLQQLSSALQPGGFVAITPPQNGYTPLATANEASGRTLTLWAAPTSQDPCDMPLPYLLQTRTATGMVMSVQTINTLPGWRPQSLTGGGNGSAQLLWVATNSGAAAVQSVTLSRGRQILERLRPVRLGYGWRAIDVTVGADGTVRLLWQHRNGAAAVSSLTARGFLTRTTILPARAGRTVVSLTTGPDNRTRVLWRGQDGGMEIQFLSRSGAVQELISFAPENGRSPVDLSVGGDNLTRIWWDQGTANGAISLTLLSATGTQVGSQTILPPSN